jgi:hypothetical protein
MFMKAWVVIKSCTTIAYEEDGLREATTSCTIEKIYTSEERAVQHIREIVQRWIENYESRIEYASTPYAKYRNACLLGGLKYVADDIREGRYINISDDLYYHYESHEVE